MINTALLLSFLVIAHLGALASDTAHVFHHADKEYKFIISEALLKGQPKWDPQSQTNPPVSIAKALKKAYAFISRLQPRSTYHWEFVSACLTPAYDSYVWTVQFHLRFDGVSSGPPQTMSCYVLMDGSVVQPVVTQVLGTGDAEADK